jgi:hypothetical protein
MYLLYGGLPGTIIGALLLKRAHTRGSESLDSSEYTWGARVSLGLSVNVLRKGLLYCTILLGAHLLGKGLRQFESGLQHYA